MLLKFGNEIATITPDVRIKIFLSSAENDIKQRLSLKKGIFEILPCDFERSETRRAVRAFSGGRSVGDESSRDDAGAISMPPFQVLPERLDPGIVEHERQGCSVEFALPTAIGAISKNVERTFKGFVSCRPGGGSICRIGNDVVRSIG